MLVLLSWEHVKINFSGWGCTLQWQLTSFLFFYLPKQNLHALQLPMLLSPPTPATPIQLCLLRIDHSRYCMYVDLSLWWLVSLSMASRLIHVVACVRTSFIFKRLFLNGPFFFKFWLSLLQYCFCFMFWCFWPQGMWDLNSLTRGWTCPPCIGRPSLHPLDRQGSPRASFLFKSE